MSDDKICLLSGYPRDREIENAIMLASKSDFALTTLRLEEIQAAIHVSAGERWNELQLGEHLRISREIPFSPSSEVHYDIFEEGGISGTLPLITEMAGIDYGILKEHLVVSSAKYPMLDIILRSLRSQGIGELSVYDLAQQIAPALGVSCKWDDPIVRRDENTWKEAKIEYEQYPLAKESGYGNILCVRDQGGHIRHLMSERLFNGKRIIVPLAFAQHPQYRQPQVCHFSFSPEWWLMGSEQLEKHSDAEVWITNSIDCGNLFDGRRVFLSYFFGKEMIPHLELDCLRGRVVKCMILQEPDALETRRNMEEAILLMSRLKSMDIKTEFRIVNKAEPILCEEYRQLGDIKIPHVLSYYKPGDVSVDQIVNLAMSYGIEIPENLHHDRYGALLSGKKESLVTDFLDSGAVTAVTVHTGVDLALVTCSIVAGFHNGAIFPEKWSCRQTIKPALFIRNNTVARHNAIFRKLSPDNFFCYEIPGGSHEDIEHRLYHIVKENGFNVFIFESRQIVQEYRKELQTACEWAQKHGIEIVIITTEEDRSAEAFFCDISSKDIHFWWSGERRNEYIVEDRPLLEGDATAFKIMFAGHSWDIKDHAEEELRSLADRNVKILHERTENEDPNTSSDPIINYRRK